MSEQWKPVQFKEISKKCGKVDYAKIIDDERGLRIKLIFENNLQIEFVFETSVISYNVCDEGRRLKTLDIILNQYGADFFGACPVYMVENSNYLKWLHEESYDIISRYTIYHFVFLTSNEVIDVLATHSPKVSSVN